MLSLMAGETPTTPTNETPAAPVAPVADTPAAPASLLGGEPPAKTEGAAAPVEGEAGKAPDAPADIDLKLPEGFAADEALQGDFKGAAKAAGLDSAKAQALFDVYAKAQATAEAKQAEDFAKQRSDWVSAVKADPEIGGDNLQASVLAANRAVAKLGGPELHQLLNATGLGDHPLLVRAFARAGALLAEDSIAGTTGGGPQGDAETARLKALYPNSPEMFSR
jgi:hypothetical protein